MSDEHTNGLHLPDLKITKFRGVENLTIDRLGHVTLLGGRNGVGKTTVLEAVRVYAARAHPSVLHELLVNREELAVALDEEHDSFLYPDYTALFHGRTTWEELPLSIGPISGSDDLRIGVTTPKSWSPESGISYVELPPESDGPALRIVFRDKERLLTWLPATRKPGFKWLSRRDSWGDPQKRQFDDRMWSALVCEFFGPGLLDNNKLARYWDSVALTDEEDLVLQALRLVHDDIERVAVVGDAKERYRGVSRRVVVKLRDQLNPIPLKSLGDGAMRVFAFVIALVNSRNGFLLLDEAENGIHYSVERDFWHMVLNTSQRHNVQVLATTHSSDCLRGFARAAAENDEAEGVYVRLDRFGNELRAIKYAEEELVTAAEQGIETR